MAAEKILGGYLSPPKAVVLCSTRDQIAAGTTAGMAARFILPFTAKLQRFDYVFDLGGSTHTADNFSLMVGSDDISEEVDGFDTAQEYSGSLRILKPQKEYDAGTVVIAVVDTGSNSTVDDFTGVLTIVPSGFQGA